MNFFQDEVLTADLERAALEKKENPQALVAGGAQQTAVQPGYIVPKLTSAEKELVARHKIPGLSSLLRTYQEASEYLFSANSFQNPLLLLQISALSLCLASAAGTEYQDGHPVLKRIHYLQKIMEHRNDKADDVVSYTDEYTSQGSPNESEVPISDSQDMSAQQGSETMEFEQFDESVNIHMLRTSRELIEDTSRRVHVSDAAASTGSRDELLDFINDRQSLSGRAARSSLREAEFLAGTGRLAPARAQEADLKLRRPLAERQARDARNGYVPGDARQSPSDASEPDEEQPVRKPIPRPSLTEPTLERRHVNKMIEKNAGLRRYRNRDRRTSRTRLRYRFNKADAKWHHVTKLRADRDTEYGGERLIKQTTIRIESEAPMSDDVSIIREEDPDDFRDTWIPGEIERYSALLRDDDPALLFRPFPVRTPLKYQTSVLFSVHITRNDPLGLTIPLSKTVRLCPIPGKFSSVPISYGPQISEISAFSANISETNKRQALIQQLHSSRERVNILSLSRSVEYINSSSNLQRVVCLALDAPVISLAATEASGVSRSPRFVFISMCVPGQDTVFILDCYALWSSLPEIIAPLLTSTQTLKLAFHVPRFLTLAAAIGIRGAGFIDVGILAGTAPVPVTSRLPALRPMQRALSSNNDFYFALNGLVGKSIHATVADSMTPFSSGVRFLPQSSSNHVLKVAVQSDLQRFQTVGDMATLSWIDDWDLRPVTTERAQLLVMLALSPWCVLPADAANLESALLGPHEAMKSLHETRPLDISTMAAVLSRDVDGPGGVFSPADILQQVPGLLSLLFWRQCVAQVLDMEPVCLLSDPWLVALATLTVRDPKPSDCETWLRVAGVFREAEYAATHREEKSTLSSTSRILQPLKQLRPFSSTPPTYSEAFARLPAYADVINALTELAEDLDTWRASAAVHVARTQILADVLVSALRATLLQILPLTARQPQQPFSVLMSTAFSTTLQVIEQSRIPTTPEAALTRALNVTDEPQSVLQFSNPILLSVTPNGTVVETPEGSDTRVLPLLVPELTTIDQLLATDQFKDWTDSQPFMPKTDYEQYEGILNNLPASHPDIALLILQNSPDIVTLDDDSDDRESDELSVPDPARPLGSIAVASADGTLSPTDQINRTVPDPDNHHIPVAPSPEYLRGRLDTPTIVGTLYDVQRACSRLMRKTPDVMLMAQEAKSTVVETPIPPPNDRLEQLMQDSLSITFNNALPAFPDTFVSDLAAKWNLPLPTPPPQPPKSESRRRARPGSARSNR